MGLSYCPTHVGTKRPRNPGKAPREWLREPSSKTNRATVSLLQRGEPSGLSFKVKGVEGAVPIRHGWASTLIMFGDAVKCSIVAPRGATAAQFEMTTGAT